MSDFEYELQIAHTNRSLNSSYETVFLVTEAHHSFLSSSLVKEVARFGGEEFVVILPYIGKANACMLAEQIREKIEELAFEGDAADIKVTISIGVATMVPSTGEDPQRLIGNADEALYKAKSTGRNRVCS